MIAGIAERETAHKAMRRWRELRAMLIILAFFVGQLMKTVTGRGICWLTVIIGKSRNSHIHTQLMRLVLV
jgi:hypothetical protein